MRRKRKKNTNQELTNFYSKPKRKKKKQKEQRAASEEQRDDVNAFPCAEPVPEMEDPPPPPQPPPPKPKPKPKPKSKKGKTAPKADTKVPSSAAALDNAEHTATVLDKRRWRREEVELERLRTIKADLDGRDLRIPGDVCDIRLILYVMRREFQSMRAVRESGIVPTIRALREGAGHRGIVDNAEYLLENIPLYRDVYRKLLADEDDA